MKLRFLFLSMALAVSALGLWAQQSAAPQWQSAKKTDASSGDRSVQFSLAGRFITAPRTGTADHPTLTVTCEADKHQSGPLGRFVAASINVSAPLKIDYVEPQEIKAGISYYPRVSVQYRIGSGKSQDESWPPTADKTGINIGRDGLKKLIYTHKEPVHRVQVSASENSGGPVVMEFDMPDPAPMATACGIAERK